MGCLAQLALFNATVLTCQAADRTQVRVEREVYLMGTRCMLTTFAPDRAEGLQQIENQLRILEEAEAQLSTWRPNSVLSDLNKQPPGVPFHAPPLLCRLFQQLQHWTSETGHAFDPAIGALARVWGLREGGRIPTPSELEAALTVTGLERFSFKQPGCLITRRAQGGTIDCGGFGKGEALDRLLESSKAGHGLPWLVDLGGQIAVYGLPPNSSSWTLDLAHPGDRSQASLTLRIDHGSLSTSAGSERDLVVNGRRVGHILDPKTGLPATFRGSVTVWHERALVADILSTALYVMGHERGKTWAEERKVAACFLVLPPDEDRSRLDATLIATSAFQHRFLRD